MNITKATKAFEIISKYDKKGEMGVGHDVLYAGGGKNADPAKMEAEDLAQLKKLGWMWDDETNSWFCFV